MIIKTKINRRDFINANFVLAYRKPLTRIVSGIFCTLILLLIFFSFFSSDISIKDILIPILAVSITPILTYWRSKNMYDSNKRSGETIEYIFDKDHLTMKGESFNSQLTWDKLYKVTQSKNWVFVWQNKQFANPIPKRDIWEGEIHTLKELLNSHNVKNNL